MKKFYPNAMADFRGLLLNGVFMADRGCGPNIIA
jgi:hypothetical protein